MTFWNCEGVVDIEFFKNGTTVDSDHCDKFAEIPHKIAASLSGQTQFFSTTMLAHTRVDKQCLHWSV